MKIFPESFLLSVTLHSLWNGSCVTAQTLSIPDFPVRSYDGTDREDGLGKANSPLLRLAEKLDIDMADESLSNPRTISNAMSSQSDSVATNKRKLSDMVWQWGQFIDHDFALTSHSQGVKVPITVPEDDEDDVLVNGGCETIPFTRTDTDANGDQINLITAFIDGSMVYGSDEKTAMALRSKEDGKMLVSTGNLLPLNGNLDSPIEGIDSAHFAAGDIRANEQLGLTAIHTVFLR